LQFIGGRKSSESGKLIKKMHQLDLRKGLSTSRSCSKKIEWNSWNLIDVVVTELSIEVEEACKRLKNNKAPGPGGIPAELVKYVRENYTHVYRNR